MLDVLKEIYTLLSPKSKRRFLLLQVLVMLTASFEIAGILAIGGFIAIMSNPELLSQEGLIQAAYQLIDANDYSYFILVSGAALLILIGLSSILSIFTTWRLTLFGAMIGADLSSRLFTHYLRESWLFHLNRNSSELSNKITLEVTRVTNNIIGQLIALNSKLVLSAFMLVTLIIYSPIVALSLAGIFLCSYGILYKVVKYRLDVNGQKLTETTNQKFKLMSEGFGGIKDIKLMHFEEKYEKDFNAANHSYFYHAANSQLIALIPRYIIELLALFCIVAIMMFFFFTSSGSLSSALPLISIFALVALKLLPAFQQVYSGLSTIRGNLFAFKNLRIDLLNSSIMPNIAVTSLPQKNSQTLFTKSLSLENISLMYPGASSGALKKVSLHISQGDIIGFVGPSGSGKSTLANIIMGLLPPSDGEIKLDNELITSANIANMQGIIGFVSQSIFLSDNSIKSNIAFGIEESEIDTLKLHKVLEQANLVEFIGSLPQGILTPVGERGVQLSGGQLQRIGIARALYRDAEILIFDEATSALDGISEKLIMKEINKFDSSKTIILIAHRLATVKNCNNIFLMDQGEIVSSGSYEHLLRTSALFQDMALKS